MSEDTKLPTLAEIQAMTPEARTALLDQLAICLPCIKEILNGGARAMSEVAHRTALATPHQIETGQISEADGEEFLRQLMSIDRRAQEDTMALLYWRAARTTPPYKLKASSGAVAGG